jgi:hypothetical protein
MQSVEQKSDFGGLIADSEFQRISKALQYARFTLAQPTALMAKPLLFSPTKSSYKK